MPRAAVEQANLDHVEVQQVLGEVQDVRLQQLDPLLDRHLREFVGRQVGQLDAGLVDRRQLLLLQHLVGHVADRDDQVLRGLVAFEDRGGVDLEVAVLARAERRGARAGRGQGRVEGAEVGAEDLRAAQHRVEIGADHGLAAGPLAQPAVAPDDRVVAVQQHDAVGHALQNLLVLQQLADLEGVAQVLGGDIQAGERLAGKPAQRPEAGCVPGRLRTHLAVRRAAAVAAVESHRQREVWVLPTKSDTPTGKLQRHYRSVPYTEQPLSAAPQLPLRSVRESVCIA